VAGTSSFSLWRVEEETTATGADLRVREEALAASRVLHRRLGGRALEARRRRS